MRRFRFPLRGVLRLRGHAVDQGLRECDAEAGSRTAAAPLAMALATALKRLQLRAQGETRAAQAAVEERRAAYLQRRSELRAMQSLHDRRRTEWQQAALTAEQSELDELARLGRAARAREEGNEP
jgi:hypothetical protein